MSYPYLGEIRQFAGTYAPVGWLLCQGQTLSIAEFSDLYTLIGITYGGDGQTTFKLPDLGSRIPVGRSTSRPLGYAAGVEWVTLTSAQMPQHSHRAAASAQQGSTGSPTQGVWAAAPTTPYSPATPLTGLTPAAVTQAGGSQPHDNMPPYLAITYIIAHQGVFPSQG